MSLEEFKAGCCCSHLECWNGTNLTVLNPYVSAMPPTKFQLNLIYRLEKMSFNDFRDGHHGDHLGYWNGTN